VVVADDVGLSTSIEHSSFRLHESLSMRIPQPDHKDRAALSIPFTFLRRSLAGLVPRG
jgi:hypothetical protein